MPVFGSSFSGLANGRKLMDEEKFSSKGVKEVEEVIEKMKQRIHGKDCQAFASNGRLRLPRLGSPPLKCEPLCDTHQL